MKTTFAMLIAAALQGVVAKPEIDAMKHDISVMMANQYNGKIGKFRDGYIHALWFMGDTSADEQYLAKYNKLAGDFKEIITFHAIDCTVPGNKNFCEKDNKITSTPAVMIYPPESLFPGNLYKNFDDEKKFKNKLAKMIPSNIETITKDNLDDFMSKDVSKPKIMLFSKQDKPAWVYKALSSEGVLRRTLKFGFTSDESIFKKYQKIMGKKTKLPALGMFKNHGKDGEKFKAKGKDGFNFRDMKEWANTFSESGMGDKVAGAGGQEVDAPLEESKPWLVQDIPELTQASHRDVCFKNEGLCVIYLTDGKISDSETEMLKGLQSQHTSQLSGRGTVLKWMWMDMATETKFKDLFSPPATPGVVVFNPHKRLRFTKPDGEDPITESGINALIDKILGGDARFKVVKGQKLPAWAKREAPEKKGKQEL